MKQILVVGVDAELSQTVEALAAGVPEVTFSPAQTVREACLLIAQKPYDLVLTSAEQAADVRRAIQALQPSMQVVAIEREGTALERDDADVFSPANLRDALGPLLGLEVVPEESAATDNGHVANTLVQGAAAAVSGDETVEPSAEEVDGGAKAVPDAAQEGVHWPKIEVLEQIANIEKIVGVLVTEGAAIGAVSGTLSDGQLHAVAQRVHDTWQDGGSALMQFLRSEEQPAQLLLYSKQAGATRLLTVAALPDYPVTRLRRVADGLANALARGNGEQANHTKAPAVVDTKSFHSAKGAGDTYAMIFQTRRPMPAALQVAVRRALQDVADEKKCGLLHQQVEAQIVHIVTRCPDAEGSAWLANLYKRGVEERLEKQFGVHAHLWKRGFYAAESERPLSDVEIRLFSGQ